LSSLEAELAAWRQAQPPSSLDRARLAGRRRAVRRVVARRVEQETPPRWLGRWSLVHRIGVWGREAPFEERIARQARQLLQAYGIVTRQALEGDEEGAWDWAELYPQLQRMEMRGEVRRGYFVRGLPGVQFALPEAVERLRDWLQPQAPGAGELVLVNACDPANLFGPAQSGEETAGNDPARFVRLPSNYVVLLRGRPVLLLELGGERITSRPDLAVDTLYRALALAVEHLSGSQRRLTVAAWNDGPILECPPAPVLERLGFRREALVYVWDG